MAEDFIRNPDQNGCIAQNLVLLHLSDLLDSMGKKITEYNLPSLTMQPLLLQNRRAKEVMDELRIFSPEQDLEAITQLNECQKVALDAILDKVTNQTGGLFFIDGPGRTGKTFLYRALLAKIRSMEFIALTIATSGVATPIMPGGRTAYSRFKIPIDVTNTSTCNISKQSGLAMLIKEAKIVLWDEAPMCKKTIFETIDRSLQDVKQSSELFGGKIVVLGGDFRQILLVVPNGTRQQIVESSLVASYLWKSVIKFKLESNMHARNDVEFSKYLICIGDGTEPKDDNGNVEIDESIFIKNIDIDKAKIDLINFVFPVLNGSAFQLDIFRDRAILAARNDLVDEINTEIILRFDGEEVVYYSFDTAVDDLTGRYQEEFLNALTPNGLLPHKLILKKKCPVMLLRNLDPANGLSNGTILICKALKNVIHAQIVTGQHKGEDVLLLRIPFYTTENETFPFKFRRKQFPIRLCFAMTINKAHGQTITTVGIYLPEPIFFTWIAICCFITGYFTVNIQVCDKLSASEW